VKLHKTYTTYKGNITLIRYRSLEARNDQHCGVGRGEKSGCARMFSTFYCL